MGKWIGCFNSHVLPGFIFNPSAVTSLIINDNNEEKEDHDQNKTMIEKK